MRSKLLLGTAVLLAGIGVASAQNAPAGGDQGARPGANAQQTGRDKADHGKAQSGQAMEQRGAKTDAQRGGQAGDRAQMQGKSEQTKSEQTRGEQSKQGKSDQAQRTEPNDRKGMPEQTRGETKGKQQETVGQGAAQNQSGPKSGKASDQKASKASDKKPDKTKAEGNQRPQDQTTGQAPQGKADQSKGAQDRAGQAGTQSQMNRDQEKNKGQSGASTSTQQTQSSTTSGSSGSVNLTTEQRTRIEQTVLTRKDVPRVNRVDFAVSVGTTVPRRVRVVEVPPTLIEIHPEWRGQRYFVANDEIIIVDRSHRIVSVVPVGSSRGSARGGPPSGTTSLSPDEIREVQQVLIQRNVYHGPADGRFTPEFREALITFQRNQGIEAVGEIDQLVHDDDHDHRPGRQREPVRQCGERK
jgi:hypothetical protein